MLHTRPGPSSAFPPKTETTETTIAPEGLFHCGEEIL